MEPSVNSDISASALDNTPVLLLTHVCIKAHIVIQDTEAHGQAKVGAKATIETEEDDCGEEALQEAAERIESVTQFPAWVKPYYVNRIRRLNCFELVREMLLCAHPSIEVARKIQELGELKTIQLDTARMYLEHYKATIPTWQFAARQKPKEYLQIKQKIEEQVNVAGELCELFHKMKKRIDIGMATDAKFGFVQANLEKNFVVAADLLMKIQLMREKMGFGHEKTNLPDSHSDTIDWRKIYGRQSVANVMRDPDARARVVGVAERLFSLYATRLSPEQLHQMLKKQLPSTKEVNEAAFSEEDEAKLDEDLIRRMNEG